MVQTFDWAENIFRHLCVRAEESFSSGQNACIFPPVINCSYHLFLYACHLLGVLMSRNFNKDDYAPQPLLLVE